MRAEGVGVRGCGFGLPVLSLEARKESRNRGAWGQRPALQVGVTYMCHKLGHRGALALLVGSALDA